MDASTFLNSYNSFRSGSQHHFSRHTCTIFALFSCLETGSEAAVLPARKKPIFLTPSLHQNSTLRTKGENEAFLGPRMSLPNRR